jgi:hypothetical protein
MLRNPSCSTATPVVANVRPLEAAIAVHAGTHAGKFAYQFTRANQLVVSR